MTYLQALILGLIQGVTEFFPISSSGHLVLFETLFNMNAEEHIFFNIILHFGTLLAIFLYFKSDLITLVKGLFSKDKNQFKLGCNIVIATLPVVLVGLLLNDYISQIFSNYKAVAVMLGLTGVYFVIAEQFHKVKTTNLFFSSLKALLVGISQAISIIPGVSRSGSTLSTGLLLGLDREKSAEFSFLIAIPAISGAVVLYTIKVLTEPELQILPLPIILTGFLASFLSGYFSIKFLMKLYKKHSLYGFSIYLIILSTILILI